MNQRTMLTNQQFTHQTQIVPQHQLSSQTQFIGSQQNPQQIYRPPPPNISLPSANICQPPANSSIQFPQKQVSFSCMSQTSNPMIQQHKNISPPQQSNISHSQPNNAIPPQPRDVTPPHQMNHPPQHQNLSLPQQNMNAEQQQKTNETLNLSGSSEEFIESLTTAQQDLLERTKHWLERIWATGGKNIKLKLQLLCTKPYSSELFAEICRETNEGIDLDGIENPQFDIIFSVLKKNWERRPSSIAPIKPTPAIVSISLDENLWYDYSMGFALTALSAFQSFFHNFIKTQQYSIYVISANPQV